MAEGITLKRIIDMDEAAELTSSDYALVDSATGGPKKFALGEELSSLKEEFTTILDSAYVTDTASGAIASFPDGADEVPVKSLVVNIEPVQSGSGDPSPTNIRPISGHTQAVVTRTGKNLIADTIINGQVGSAGGFTSSTNRMTNVNAESSPVLSDTWLKAGKYTLSCSGLNNCTVLSKDASGSIIDNFATSWHDLPYTFTLTKGAYVLFTVRKGDNSDITVSDYHPQIDVGESASTYEPYHGETVTIDLDGTRYGGTLDVGTGVLTVDKGLHTFNGTEAWEDYPSFSGFVTREINGLMKSGIRQDGWSNMLKVSKDSTAGQTNAMWLGVNSSLFFAIGVYESMGNTVDAFKTYLSEHNLELVYPLANPFTVQLTAEEVTTLLGQNNLWNDCGNTEVEYRADTKLYIEKLTAPTEDDMIADHAISANTFFMVGNTLYRATTAIASGATITVGTNATKMSLSEALNALS